MQSNNKFSVHCSLGTKPCSLKVVAIHRSASGPSIMKTYSSVTCNMTLLHDKNALGHATLASNILNLNQGSPTWCPWAPGCPYGPCWSPTDLFWRQHKHNQCLHIDK